MREKGGLKDSLPQPQVKLSRFRLRRHRGEHVERDRRVLESDSALRIEHEVFKSPQAPHRRNVAPTVDVPQDEAQAVKVKRV